MLEENLSLLIKQPERGESAATPHPTMSDAGDVDPAGTRTQNTYTLHIYIYTLPAMQITDRYLKHSHKHR